MGNSMTIFSTCKEGDLSKLRQVLQDSMLLKGLEEQDSSGRTGLLMCCDLELSRNPPTVEIIEELARKNVNMDHQDENGWTALHYCCFRQHFEAIDCLLSHGSTPLRDNNGFLPQDWLLRPERYTSDDKATERYNKLASFTKNVDYSIVLYGLRASGVVAVNLGDRIQSGALMTVHYQVPETHSEKDYIQLLYFEGDQTIAQTGPLKYVPKGSEGRLIFHTEGLPCPCTCRFRYIKSDTSGMSRSVVATGCTASIVESIDESVEFDLFVLDRVLEIESIPEFLFAKRPHILLKRIGIRKQLVGILWIHRVMIVVASIDGQDPEWTTLKDGNFILAVNDQLIAEKDFEGAISLLQSNTGSAPTKLRVVNASIRGDFIPEKALGSGVVGKFAEISPLLQDENITPGRDSCLSGESWDEREFSDAISSPLGLGTIEKQHEIPNGMAMLHLLIIEPLRVMDYERIVLDSKQDALEGREAQVKHIKTTRQVQELDELNWLKKRKMQRYHRRLNQYDYIQTLKDWFKSLDADASGEISLEELVVPLLSIGAAENVQEVRDLFRKVDLDGSGQIGFDEFCILLSKGSKGEQHPLNKLCESIDATGMSIQSEIPRHCRHDLLQALTDVRYQQDFERVEAALEFESDQQAKRVVSSSSTGHRGGIQHIHRQVLAEASRTRRQLASRERALGVDVDLLSYYNDFNQRPSTVSSGDLLPRRLKTKKKKRQPRIVTYTYAPGELIPHQTVVPLGEKGRRRPLKHVQPVIRKGSSKGKVPLDLVNPLSRQMKMLGLKVVTKDSVQSSSPEFLKRKVGASGGRWGYLN